MISKTIKVYCSTPELIYNYDKAVASPEMCECHHRRELEFTHKELRDRGEYFNRPPEELIFLTVSEHRWLHENVCKGWEKFHEEFSDEEKQKISKSLEGIKRSDETKEKMSKNNARYWKGKKHSAESIKKMTESRIGKKHSEKTKELMSKAQKGKHWWNNGIDRQFCRECPGEGWVQGYKLKCQIMQT